ncbi:MAG: ATP-binding protein [Propionicimonas sp.]|uniref:sensor histidine kinase n=1 Tax=Propionicimonas sp. TaxID=1955623 RepID=UPI003D09DD94
MPGLRPGERFTRTFYGRLLLGQLAVGVVLLVTVAAVTTSVAPGLFEQDLVENGPLDSADQLHFVEGAFLRALWLSLAVAIVVAASVAVAIGLATVRPLRRQLRELSGAARAVAAGDFARRVEPGPDAGEEIRLLASSFNTMATQLGDAEEARQRLLADLAHELRTPIASLSVTVEALADGVRDADEATLSTLSEQAGRLARLAGDLRDISDAEGGLSVHTAPCRVADLLEDARSAAAEEFARKGVALVVEGEPGGEVDADAQRIGQVLANLLSNALRHTPPGGRVTLAASPVAGGTAMTVTDTGDGIDAAHLPRVFDRFYRTDAARSRDSGGTGIGLAVSAAIAKAHGGTLTVASSGVGHGAVFTLTLPS